MGLNKAKMNHHRTGIEDCSSRRPTLRFTVWHKGHIIGFRRTQKEAEELLAAGE